MLQKTAKFIILILLVVTAFNACSVYGSYGNKGPFKVTTENPSLPYSYGYVNDYEGILTDKQEKQLSKIIKEHEKATTDQIAIITLPSIEPYKDLDTFSLDLANYWGVGQKDKNNGILIAFGKELRNIRIQNGYGIEARLTDAETKKIIEELILPEFKTDNHYEGLRKGILAIIEELK